MPVDAQPVDNGNIVLHPVPGCPPLALYMSTPPEPGEVRYVSHFATCAAADQHRRR